MQTGAMADRHVNTPVILLGEKRKMLPIVAAIGALAHLGFAWQETVGWGPKFVRTAAKAWMRDPQADAHVAWARNLAFNMGIYNLMLAIGLAWTAAADQPVASSLGKFFALWLLGAAAAAAYTRVWLAVIAQGVLGVMLGLAAW